MYFYIMEEGNGMLSQHVIAEAIDRILRRLVVSAVCLTALLVAGVCAIKYL